MSDGAWLEHWQTQASAGLASVARGPPNHQPTPNNQGDASKPAAANRTDEGPNGEAMDGALGKLMHLRSTPPVYHLLVLVRPPR